MESNNNIASNQKTNKKYKILDRDPNANELQKSMDLRKFLEDSKNQLIQEGLFNAARVITNKKNSSKATGITKKNRNAFRKEETKAYGLIATHMGPNSSFAVEQDDRYQNIYKSNRIDLALYIQIIESTHTSSGLKNNDMILANLRTTLQLPKEALSSFASRYIHTISVINETGGIHGNMIREGDILTNFIQNLNSDTKNYPSGKIFNQIIGNFFDIDNEDRRLIGFINFLNDGISKRKQISNLTGNPLINPSIETTMLGNDNNLGASDSNPQVFNSLEDKDECFVCKECGYFNAAKTHSFKKCRRLIRMIEAEKKLKDENPSPYKNQDSNNSPFKKKKNEEPRVLPKEKEVLLAQKYNYQLDDTDDGF